MRTAGAIDVVSLAWFSRESFDQILELWEDGHIRNWTYEEWMREAEAERDRLKATGSWVLCVDVDPVEFVHWCITHGSKFNTEALDGFSRSLGYEVLTGAKLRRLLSSAVPPSTPTTH
jgi:hypothetical protein